MESTQQFPRGCELDEITSLAIASCDELDGVKDGIISDVDACRQSFDPFKQIGKSFHCSGTNSKIKISHAAAAVANASWSGPRFSDGRFMYYGFEIGTALSEVAPTKCTGDTCVGTRQDFAFAYQAFVNRKVTTELTNITARDFDTLYRNVKLLYASNLETNDIDLRDFRDAGGKMITFHGLVRTCLVYREPKLTLFRLTRPFLRRAHLTITTKFPTSPAMLPRSTSTTACLLSSIAGAAMVVSQKRYSLNSEPG